VEAQPSSSGRYPVNRYASDVPARPAFQPEELEKIPNKPLTRRTLLKMGAVGTTVTTLATAGALPRRKSFQPLTVTMLLCCIIGLLTTSCFNSSPPNSSPPNSGPSNFGHNVYIFNSRMPQSQIQATLNSIAAHQISNEFGTQRYALLFEPGTYGSKTNPLNFQVGYYTSVAGLGLSPKDVVINGSADVYNQCSGTTCNATTNFWRSLSNLTINVTTPNAGCYNG